MITADVVRAGKLTVFVFLMLVATVSFHFTSPYLISDALRLGTHRRVRPPRGPRRAFEAVQAAGAAVGQLLRRHHRAVIGWLALFVFGVACALGHWVLDPIPHVSDEVAYLFQARVFASGRLSVPAPPLPEFFPSEWLIIHDGRWFGIFPPGWPLLLSLGVRLGVPSLVNPTLGALGLIAIHRLAELLIGEAKALVVALLCALSPFFLFQCASFLSHPASLLFTTLSALYLLRGAASGRPAPFVASGCLAAMAFLIRPLDALAIWSVAAGALALRHRTRRQLAGTCLSAAGLAVGVLAYLAYNRALGGQWLQPLLTLTSPANRLGFGPDVGLPPGHDLRHAAMNLNFNLAVLGSDLFGWPISSLCFVFLLLCFGRLAWPHRLSALLVASLAVAYLFYWYNGVCFGARFYFASLPFLLILTVEGVSQAPMFLPARIGSDLVRRAAFVKTFVALCFGFAVLVYLPAVSMFEPYHNQRNVDTDLAHFVADRRIDQAIVFVGPEPQDYASGVFANALDPAQGRIVYALELGARDAQLIDRFPGREVFHYRHPRVARVWPGWLQRVLRRGYLIDLARRSVALFRGRGG